MQKDTLGTTNKYNFNYYGTLMSTYFTFETSI